MFSRDANLLSNRPPFVARERFVEAGGYRVRYLEAGDGPPVVLVPTMFLVADSYRHTIRHLGRRSRVITVESPGSGHSQPLRGPWSLEDYAHWLAEFLGVMGLGPVPVIGHSNSAAVALILAALHPERVSHAILADPIGAIRSPSLWRLVPVHFSVGMVEMEFTALIFSHILYNFIHHWGSLLRQPLFAKLDLTAYAPRVAVPILLAWGRQDLTTPLYCARRFHALIPRSQVHVCGGGSHDWIITHPGEFAEAVRRFVGTPKCP